jgi:hypothetical protein
MQKIPRGKAKAPAAVMPKSEVTEESLKLQFAKINASINELTMLDKNSNFNHPYFGMLNLSSTIKFLEIHTKHHLKIIEEIIVN